MAKLTKSNQGFTIIELLLAMTFFSFVMLFTILGFMQINRSYHRGITQKNIQNAARQAVDDIADHVRNADVGSIVIPPPGNFRICVGATRFGYNQHVGASPMANSFSGEVFSDDATEEITLARSSDPTTPCTGTNGIPRDENLTQTLLDDNIMVQHLSLQQVGTTSTYLLTLVVSTDNRDDFETYGFDAACEVETGDEFCHVVKLETAVTARN